MLYVVTRVDGKLVREPVGHNRKQAERLVTKTRHEQDEGRYIAPKAITFEDWSAEWFESLKRP